MLRGNIAATSLKMLLKNLYSVNCYNKLNMNVLTLSLWENFCWGLIYFDQFIWHAHGDLCKHLGIDSSTDLNDRYLNLFLNAYINRHAHTYYLKMI